MVFYKCMGKISDLKNEDQATKVVSIADEHITEVWSSDARTSRVIRQQGIHKDVPSARQAAEEISLLACCYGHQFSKELGTPGKKACFGYPQLILSPITRGKFFRQHVR